MVSRVSQAVSMVLSRSVVMAEIQQGVIKFGVTMGNGTAAVNYGRRECQGNRVKE
jgi:hypothetical protein